MRVDKATLSDERKEDKGGFFHWKRTGKSYCFHTRHRASLNLKVKLEGSLECMASLISLTFKCAEIVSGVTRICHSRMIPYFGIKSDMSKDTSRDLSPPCSRIEISRDTLGSCLPSFITHLARVKNGGLESRDGHVFKGLPFVEPRSCRCKIK